MWFTSNKIFSALVKLQLIQMLSLCCPLVQLPWEGLSAVSFGVLLHLFSASVSLQRFFVDPNLQIFFATVLQPESLAIHESAAGRLRPTGAWGRWPAGIFSICVRMARVSRPAQSVDSPGRLSVVRRIGRHSAIGPDIESLRSERTTNQTSHSSDAQQRRWLLFEFRDLSHK